jgi:D-sedoheptulose 7-phosphate isomerase
VTPPSDASVSTALAARLASYRETTIAALGTIDLPAVARVIDRISEAWSEDRRVLVFGNGGSATTAAHLAEDLATYAIPFEEPRRLQVLSLADSPSVITALGNDLSFEDVFAEQVQQWARPGDVVIAMSGSGNSPNILAGVDRARKIGCCTVGLTGFDGGALRERVDIPLHVDVPAMQNAQDGHMVIVHLIIDGFRARARGELHPDDAFDAGETGEAGAP